MKYTFIFSSLILLISASFSSAQDSKPYFEKKMVLALNTPLMNFSKNIAFLKGMRYEDYLEGVQHVGKYRTYSPIVANMTNPMELDDALAYEILMAKKMGIDGFKFPIFINANLEYVNKLVSVISEYIKVAEDRDLDFKFALLIDFKRQNGKLTQDELFDRTVKNLNLLLKETTYSPKWVRNSSDQIVLFTKSTCYVTDKIFTEKGIKGASSVISQKGILQDIKATFEKIKVEVGTNFSVVYESRYPNNRQYNNILLNHFPVITQTQYSAVRMEESSALREVCKKRKRPIFQVVTPEYVNTQLYLKSNNKKLSHKAQITKTTKLEETYCKVHNTKLTSTFRKGLEMAIQNDVDLIDVQSWNNYGEGSHMSPELHHGYSFGLLLELYKNKWMTGDFSIHKEMVMTSYKAYTSQYLNTTNITIKRKNKYYEEDAEDQIEIIAIMNEPSSIYCNGNYIGEAHKGISVFYAPSELGNVHVVAERKGKKFINYKTEKTIIDNPEKVDWLTYSFTNIDDELETFSINITNQFMMQQMYKRFIISGEKQGIWKRALIEKYTLLKENFYQNGNQSSKYKDLKEDINKDYRSRIKRILESFEYDVWVDMEEKAEQNQGVIDFNKPIVDVMDGYNVLQIEK